jgi:hypothetical protein
MLITQHGELMWPAPQTQAQAAPPKPKAAAKPQVRAESCSFLKTVFFCLSHLPRKPCITVALMLLSRLQVLLADLESDPPPPPCTGGD